MAEEKTEGSPPTGESRFVHVANAQEAKSFNFLAEREPGKRTNFIESVGHLIKSCLGGGVVAIHEAYKLVGLHTALVLNIVLGVAVTYLMLVLARSAQKVYGRVRVPAMSFPDLAEASLQVSPFPKLKKYSKCFRYAVDVTIMIDLFGSCCAYQVVIANSFRDFMKVYNPDFPMTTREVVACLLIPCILICMILTLKVLAPFSIFADIVIILTAITTMIYGLKANTKPMSEFEPFKNVTGLFQYLGVCVFSMEGVGVTLPIENHMQNPYIMNRVLWCGMSVVVGIVMMVGFFGYYGFGEDSKVPVTNNFPMDGYTATLKIALPVMIYITFALNFWVPFELVWVYLKKKHPADKHWLWERIYRAIFVVGITIISVVFPDVTKLISVIGSFCLSNMGFIYPAFIELMLDWEDPGLGMFKWRLWKFVFFFIFGIILMIVGTASNFKELVTTVFKKHGDFEYY